MQCPNCKAPMRGPVCEYCGTVVEQKAPQAPGVAVNINIGGRPMNTGAAIPGVSVQVNGGSQYSYGRVPRTEVNAAAGSFAQGYSSEGQYQEYAGYGAAPAYVAGYAAGRASAQADYGYDPNTGTYVHVSTKSWAIALVLCFFIGYLGAHYFYVGKWGWGLVYLFTAGFFGIGWFVDIIRILIGSFTDVNGLPLNKNAAVVG